MIKDMKGQTKSGQDWRIYNGDVIEGLKTLETDKCSFDCIITSPPYYWQRDYKTEGQIGLESQIGQYVKNVTNAINLCKPVLKKDGLLFLNLGDTYYSGKGQPKGDDKKNQARRFGLRAVDASGLGVPRKTAIGMPWRVALKLIDLGWVLRSSIVWHRPTSVPEPTAHDRPHRNYELIFMLSKSPRYWFNREALGNDEDVWTISDRRRSNKGLHAAAFPDQIVQKCLSIGCKPGGSVLDPFAGTGTTIRVALETGRSATGIDLSQVYCSYMIDMLKDV